MRILVFYQYFGTPKGSWSTRMYEFCRRWVKKGHHVTVVTAPYEKSDIKAERFITRKNFDGIDLIIINSPDSNRRSTFIRGLSAVRFAFISTWYALTLKFDVVLASSGPITVGIPSLLAKWLRKKKMVFEVRDLWPQGAVELDKIKGNLLIKVAYKFEKTCYLNSSLVVVASKGMKESINERYCSVQTLVIPNVADLALFAACRERLSEEGGDKKAKCFIYAGSLGLMDDFEQCIDAMVLVRRNDIKLVVIGDGAERNDLEAKVKDLDLKNVEFIGLIPKTELIKWYSEAYASILTVKDNKVIQTFSPNKMFDSFAAGVPIIQNSTGWIKEMVEINKCGLNVEQHNPRSFADAITHLADNPLERDVYAQNAFSLAQSEFDVDILAEKYISAILAL